MSDVKNFINKYPKEFNELVEIFKKFNFQHKSPQQQIKQEVEIKNIIDLVIKSDSELSFLNDKELIALIKAIKDEIFEAINEEDLKKKIKAKAEQKKRELLNQILEKKKIKLQKKQIEQILEQLNIDVNSKDFESLFAKLVDNLIKNVEKENNEKENNEKIETINQEISAHQTKLDEQKTTKQNDIFSILANIQTGVSYDNSKLQNISKGGAERDI